MTSSGGLLPFAVASAQAGRLVLSGPAAGVVAATALGRAKGHASIISFDMGGTSTDACRVTGRAVHTTRAQWGGMGGSRPLLAGADYRRRRRKSGLGGPRGCAAGGTEVGWR